MASNSKPNVSNDTLNTCGQWLYKHCGPDLKSEHGLIKMAAQKFGLSTRRIHTIWAEAKLQIRSGMPIFIHNKKKGRLRDHRMEVPYERLLAKDFEERGTIRDIALQLGDVSKSTVGRWVKEKKLYGHTCSVHPLLSDSHKLQRLEFCVRSMYFDKDLNVLKFKSMKLTLHMDEKWYYLRRKTSRGYLLPGEKKPYRAVQHIGHVTKVMFLCVVGRPIYIGEICVFDGKIGVFAFTVQVPAARKSKNRPRGTIETKAQTAVTQAIMQDVLINKVIPAIKARWPAMLSKTIYLQQDNARPHIKDTDLAFRLAASSDGFDIHLVHQPPQSPDLNINDLGWFRTLQALQIKRRTLSVDQLVEIVEKSFDELSHYTLNKVFLSLQCYMIEIMKVRGHNDFVAPHMGKDALFNQGLLPIDLEVDKNLGKDCLYYLLQAGLTGGLEEMMEDLNLHDTGLDLNL